MPSSLAWETQTERPGAAPGLAPREAGRRRTPGSSDDREATSCPEPLPRLRDGWRLETSPSDPAARAGTQTPTAATTSCREAQAVYPRLCVAPRTPSSTGSPGSHGGQAHSASVPPGTWTRARPQQTATVPPPCGEARPWTAGPSLTTHLRGKKGFTPRSLEK